MRSLAHALWTMVATLVGLGIGPLAVGMLSDLWRSAGDAGSLMWGLIVVSATLPLSAVGYAMAARSLVGDLERANHIDPP